MSDPFAESFAESVPRLFTSFRVTQEKPSMRSQSRAKNLSLRPYRD